jgi:hypothetical protein
LLIRILLFQKLPSMSNAVGATQGPDCGDTSSCEKTWAPLLGYCHLPLSVDQAQSEVSKPRQSKLFVQIFRQASAISPLSRRIQIAFSEEASKPKEVYTTNVNALQHVHCLFKRTLFNQTSLFSSSHHNKLEGKFSFFVTNILQRLAISVVHSALETPISALSRSIEKPAEPVGTRLPAPCADPGNGFQTRPAPRPGRPWPVATAPSADRQFIVGHSNQLNCL